MKYLIIQTASHIICHHKASTQIEKVSEIGIKRSIHCIGDQASSVWLVVDLARGQPLGQYLDTK